MNELGIGYVLPRSFDLLDRPVDANHIEPAPSKSMRNRHTSAAPEIQYTGGVRQASYHLSQPAIAHDGLTVTRQIGPSDHIIAVGYD